MTHRDRPLLVVLTSNILSLIGAMLVTTAVLSWLFVLPLHMRGHVGNPYIGIILFLVLPGVFFAGLTLIPIGIYLAKRRIRKGLQEEVDHRTAWRKLGWFFAVTTVLNLVIGTQLTYRAVEHMETLQFCGQSCHVMKPEFSAYQVASHSSVACVECHVAPGASGWFQSKMNGTRQMVEVVFNTYPRPVPSAIASGKLVSSAETCEKCHGPRAGGGVKLKVIPKFADDQTNTETKTVLLMMVGTDKGGIHGTHMAPGVTIRFKAKDRDRQTIPLVEYTNSVTGANRRYLASGEAENKLGNLQTYTMQCIDCHNRPAHTFESPEQATDQALTQREINAALPFIKKKSVELLKAQYTSQTDAAEKMQSQLRAYYDQHFPDVAKSHSTDIQKAGHVLSAIYSRNVFPDLKVTWGTYINNLGHMDSPGCFRCHDGGHATSDGKQSIGQDCNSCHQSLAVDEADPDILKKLGLTDQTAGSK